MGSIGERIKQLRIEHKMTLEQLGEKVGVGKSTVRKWENGMIANMRQDKIAKLAEALNTTPAHLMGWENEEKYKVNSIIGHILKTLRTERNLSLFEISEEMHITVEEIECYENGIKKVPIEFLRAFAKFYNVNIDELMGIDLETERKHVVFTNDEILKQRYYKWKKAIGYNKYSDKEIDQLIEIAKLMQQMNDNEINQTINYMQFLINQRQK